MYTPAPFTSYDERYYPDPWIAIPVDYALSWLM